MSAHAQSKVLAKTYVWPYSDAAKSSGTLANALGINRIKREGSSIETGAGLFIINWGAGGNLFPRKYTNATILNKPEAVLNSVNKLRFFEQADTVDGLRIPEYTTSKVRAKSWLNKGYVVLARTTLEGAAGEGIVVMTKPEDLVNASLYTQYIEKEFEYRVYMVGDKHIDVWQKMRKVGVTITNERIRTDENGFVYVHKDLATVVSLDILNQCRLAMKASGLDFAGIDIVMAQKEQNKAYVLEVNSAPWLAESTAEKLAEALSQLLISKGAKFKAHAERVPAAQEPASPPLAQVGPTAAPGATTTVGVRKDFTFTATFVRPGGGWGLPAGVSHTETFRASSWSKALQGVDELVQPGWTLTELKAA